MAGLLQMVGVVGIVAEVRTGSGEVVLRIRP